MKSGIILMMVLSVSSIDIRKRTPLNDQTFVETDKFYIDDFLGWLYCKFINCNYGKKEGTAAANEGNMNHHGM